MAAPHTQAGVFAVSKAERSAEARVLGDCLVALSHVDGCMVWRQQSGLFLTSDGRRKVRVGEKGMSDLGGLYKGRCIQIEVKGTRGRVRPEQRRWGQLIEQHGGIFCVAYDWRDAVLAVTGDESWIARVETAFPNLKTPRES